MDRIKSFDILKGFGILLMIVAHTFGPDNRLWDFIYAFHMPLFFIVSGYFFKHRPFLELFKKNRDQLLIQYIVLCAIVTLLTQIRQPHNLCTDLYNTLNGMGPGWFLLALFLTRIEFNYILRLFPNYYLFISFIISTCVCFVANYYDISTMLSFFPSLIGLFFLATGYYIREHSLLDYSKRHPCFFLSASLFFWLTTSIYGKVEMSQCLFKLSIIDFCGSIGGTFLVYKLSQFIGRSNNSIKNILANAGKYSLVILFFHSIDYCVPVWYLFQSYFPSHILLYIILFLRLLLVTICVILSLRTKWTRTFFKIKT